MAGHSRPKDGVASARLCPGHPRLYCRDAVKTWMPGTSSAKTRFCPGMTERAILKSQLRLVALLDHGLAFRLAEIGLLVDHLADAGHDRAFNPRLRRPQLCAHQRLAAMEIGLV